MERNEFKKVLQSLNTLQDEILHSKSLSYRDMLTLEIDVLKIKQKLIQDIVLVSLKNNEDVAYDEWGNVIK